MVMSRSSLSRNDRQLADPMFSGSRVHPGWFANTSEIAAAEEEPSSEVLFDVFTKILMIGSALDRNAADALEDLHLTAGAFNALVELGKVGDEGIAPSELARRLAVARRTATLYVDILTKQGWAIREAHPGDKRMVLARLSDQGKRLLETEGDRYQRRLSNLLGDISAVQAERLRQLLSQITTDIRV